MVFKALSIFFSYQYLGKHKEAMFLTLKTMIVVSLIYTYVYMTLSPINDVQNFFRDVHFEHCYFVVNQRETAVPKVQL